MSPSIHSLDFNQHVSEIRQTHSELAAHACRAVNVSLTLRNWLIGCHIAEYELNGADRATYGDRVLKELQAGSGRRPAVLCFPALLTITEQQLLL
ncbi:DUF1016 N-terminal domain-containing protein [Chlorobaculum parvum]|uniref:hypothetical protein n=1 Tax=Chlorobaculum parvum TaxID=274539 RepID=UPI000A05D62C|nr:hypothetical protein [Chlorobaculum parvum]